MSRLQFRVWDKEKQEMLYDGFIVRHNNDNVMPWEKKHPHLAHTPKQWDNYEAEPLEQLSYVQNNFVGKIMGDPASSYSLIDWSNWYGQENYVTMQATCFHDKNGQVIWEGDLLEYNGIVEAVSWHYSSYIWNGQMISDFREFDAKGNLLSPIAGYQGDIYGLQTENLIKVGTIYEQGKQYGFSEEAIDGYKPKLPN